MRVDRGVERLVPLAGFGVVSAASMTIAAAVGDQTLSQIWAILFAVAVIFWIIGAQAPLWWSPPPSHAATEAYTVCVAGSLVSLVYAWGGLAMLGVYLLSGLRWQHGWQYGTAMLLVAGLIGVYSIHHPYDEAGAPSRPALDTAFWLTAIHGIAAVTGLAFLIASGKPWLEKPDWAANQIFLAGGIAVVIVCLVAGATQVRLARLGQ